MISVHFPVLLILVPLMAAPICMFFRPVQGATWVIATAVSWFCLYVAVSLLLRVLDSGTISYLLGNWAAPWGIEYRIDLLNAFVLVIVAAVAAVEEIADEYWKSVVRFIDQFSSNLWSTPR